MIADSGGRWPGEPYDVAPSDGPIAGCVTQAAELRISTTTVYGLLVLRLIDEDGREFHWPCSARWLVDFAGKCSQAARAEVAKPPFVPGKFRYGEPLDG